MKIEIDAIKDATEALDIAQQRVWVLKSLCRTAINTLMELVIKDENILSSANQVQHLMRAAEDELEILDAWLEAGLNVQAGP